ncbi:hypothetical protein ACTXGQ_04160 [Marinobacter sp. 1Y8]
MRDVHPDLIDAFQSRLFRPIYFVEILFDTPLRFTSAYASVTLGGVEYFGAGNLGSVGPVEEGTDLDPQEFKISVAGISHASLAAVVTERYLNRSARCLVGLLSDEGQMIGEPLEYFSGLTDEIQVDFGKIGAISITVRDRLADWARPKVERYTNADQQARYPGDKGLEFVSQVADKDIVWPASSFF